MRTTKATGRIPKKGEPGFTLVEVLIAIVIFAIGIMAVMRMQVQAMTGTGVSRVYVDTANLAQDRLERLKATSIRAASMNAGSYNDATAPNNYTIQWTIADNGGATAAAKTITVVATHGSGRNTTLTAVKADDGT